MGTRKDKRCRHAVVSCSYCTTGVYKRGARRAERRAAKKAIRTPL